MIEEQELYFELFDAGNIVRLEPLKLIAYDADLDWDKNWVKTTVTVKGGKFSGQYSGDMMTVDFEKFNRFKLVDDISAVQIIFNDSD